VLAPFGLTVPFNVAVVAVMADALPVVTVGKGDTSSLVIVTVALLGEPTVYAYVSLESNVTITVSLPSTTISLIGVTVTAADADFLGIVTLVPMLL
jgi:hypothetical protein